MMIQNTLTQLRGLRLNGFAKSLEEQLSQAGISTMAFEERLALLVDREMHYRSDRRQARLLKEAKLKYPQATIEDLNTKAGRGINRSEVLSLLLGDWIKSGHNVLITGATGSGKSWLACAMAQYACRQGCTALYCRVPRLQEEFRVMHGSGTFTKWLLQLAKTDVLVLDDWGMGTLDGSTRSDLLEIIDDRSVGRATIVTGQLPIEHWHAWIGDVTIADAILDRIMQQHHRFILTGDSMRQSKPKNINKEENIMPS